MSISAPNSCPPIFDCLNDDVLDLICASLYDKVLADKRQLYLRAPDKVRRYLYLCPYNRPQHSQ